MTKPKPPERQRPLKANYQGATPEQVAKAVLRYRPQKPVRHPKEGRK